jgi:CRISPR-associated protein (Cas_Cas02710)
MSKILLVTVGGSFQPIVTAISSLQPDRIIFIASDGEKGSKSQVIGEGTPCEVRRGVEILERLPNIPTQVGLGDRFQQGRDLILVQNPDNLSECYPKIHAFISNLQKEASYEIMADYTGGTKTLSAALVLAAVDCGIALYITIAARDNLVKVERGEVTQRVDTSFRS